MNFKVIFNGDPNWTSEQRASVKKVMKLGYTNIFLELKVGLMLFNGYLRVVRKILFSPGSDNCCLYILTLDN